MANPRSRAAAVLLGMFTTAAATALPGQAQTAPQDPRDRPADLATLSETFAAVRERNARDYAIAVPPGVDDAGYVRIGGIEQWITIRGTDRANPVVLLLHGGPGDATNPWGYAGLQPWLYELTVVQWDQRGSGRTYARNRTADASISVEQLVQDGLEVAEHARRALGGERLVILGHSWGSTLGRLMAKARPELFHAFVGTGLVADPAENYAVAYRALRAEADRRGDRVASRELEAIGPPPYGNGRGYAVQRKWANRFEGADTFIAAMFGLALGAPGYTAADINDWIDGQGVSSARLVPQTNALTADHLAGRFEIPVFVIQGLDDFTTPTSLARRFVKAARAPRKAFVTIRGGHFAAFMQPAAFLDALRRQLRGIGVGGD